MYLDCQEDSQTSFLRRIAPLFHVNPDDEDALKTPEAKNFVKLSTAFDMAPTLEKETAQNCVELFLNNKEALHLQQNIVFYYMFKYHAENITAFYTGTQAYEIFSPQEVRLINEVFDTYCDVDYMLRMTDLEADFLMNFDFDTKHYNTQDMDIYRVQAATDINTSLYLWHREANNYAIFDKKCTSYLDQISRLDKSSSPVVQRRVNDVCDGLLDYMNYRRPHLSPTGS